MALGRQCPLRRSMLGMVPLLRGKGTVRRAVRMTGQVMSDMAAGKVNTDGEEDVCNGSRDGYAPVKRQRGALLGDFVANLKQCSARCPQPGTHHVQRSGHSAVLSTSLYSLHTCDRRQPHCFR